MSHKSEDFDLIAKRLKEIDPGFKPLGVKKISPEIDTLLRKAFISFAKDFNPSGGILYYIRNGNSQNLTAEEQRELYSAFPELGGYRPSGDYSTQGKP